MSVLIWLFLLLFGLGGFMSGEDMASEAEVEAPPEPSATEIPASVDAFPDDLPVPTSNQEIQDRFASRWPVPSCGFVDLASGSGSKGWRCLQDAVGSTEGAELVVLDFADHMPMRTTTYRVNPDGPLEIFVDVSQVPGTAPTWEYRRCRPSQDLRTEPCAS